MNNKKLVMTAAVVLGILVILYLISLVTKADVQNETLRLKDEKMFYQIQNEINNYLIEKNYNNPEFTLKKVFYKEDKLTTYYFANGYIIDIVMEDYEYVNNVNYLLVVKGNTYNLYELKDTQNETYLDTLNKNQYQFTDGKIFQNISYTEKNKLEAYISEYLTLLSVDNAKAYQMLTTSTKNKYRSYNDFSNRYSEIYDQLDTNIKNYGKTETNDSVTYDIIDVKGNKIKIIETTIMDYKIEY